MHTRGSFAACAGRGGRTGQRLYTFNNYARISEEVGGGLFEAQDASLLGRLMAQRVQPVMSAATTVSMTQSAGPET